MKAHYVLRNELVRANCAERIHTDPELADHEVVIRPFKSKRSLEQNDYLWRLMRAAAEPLGYSPEELHKAAKDAYGGHTEKVVAGVTVRVLNFSTSKAKVDEMRLYLDWLEPWLMEHTGIDPRGYR